MVVSYTYTYNNNHIYHMSDVICMKPHVYAGIFNNWSMYVDMLWLVITVLYDCVTWPWYVSRVDVQLHARPCEVSHQVMLLHSYVNNTLII